MQLSILLVSGELVVNQRTQARTPQNPLCWLLLDRPRPDLKTRQVVA